MASFEFEIPETTSRKLTVSELTHEIKFLLETSIPVVWVEGEISNFKHHSSGHIYLTLKDELAQIPCVMWRSRNAGLFFTPQDGMKVLAQGQVTVYEKRGAYQLDILQLKPAGVGELQLAFEQLKRKLKAEGLFEEHHKQPIPFFPERIGIVTSPTGAALHDMITVIHRRNPGVEIILRPVKVQGEGAATEIVAAISELNDFGEVDLIIVGRGGGSIEDLWAFNEEAVARAIFHSKIPIISAVGHEVDFCISDFVADLRAPTPSVAAELAVPDTHELAQHLRMLREQAISRITDKIQSYWEQLKQINTSYGFRRPADLIQQYYQRLDELYNSLSKSMVHYLLLQNERLNALHKNLLTLNPTAILARGYSICFDPKTGTVIKSVQQLKPEDTIKIQFHQGKALSEIKQIESE